MPTLYRPAFRTFAAELQLEIAGREQRPGHAPDCRLPLTASARIRASGHGFPAPAFDHRIATKRWLRPAHERSWR